MAHEFLEMMQPVAHLAMLDARDQSELAKLGDALRMTVEELEEDLAGAAPDIEQDAGEAGVQPLAHARGAGVAGDAFAA